MDWGLVATVGLAIVAGLVSFVLLNVRRIDGAQAMLDVILRETRTMAEVTREKLDPMEKNIDQQRSDLKDYIKLSNETLSTQIKALDEKVQLEMRLINAETAGRLGSLTESVKGTQAIIDEIRDKELDSRVRNLEERQ